MLVLCCGKKYVPIVAPTRFIYVALTCVENVISYYYARDEVQQVPFAVLETLIRLGHKYAVQDVLQEALGRLKKYYPTTLDEWSDAVGRARWIQTTPVDAIEVNGTTLTINSTVAGAPEGKLVGNLDTGTSYVWAPQSVVQAIYGNFPGYSSTQTQFNVPCFAQVSVAIHIG